MPGIVHEAAHTWVHARKWESETWELLCHFISNALYSIFKAFRGSGFLYISHKVMFLGAGHCPRGQKIPPIHMASYHRPLSFILGLLYWPPATPVLFDHRLGNTATKKWGWVTVKFFSQWKKVKSSLGWEFSSNRDLCISLLEKRGHLV